VHKKPNEILETYWGFTSFKDSQEKIITASLEGRDVLALLPTGGGKSICFQIPALMQDGICIVVSPLIALIQNQVSNLKNLGIKAVGLSGSLRFEELSNELDNCVYGGYKFLYLSPERLGQELIQERILQMNVNLLVVDEAHCISQWGHDFRPAYLQCAILRELHPAAPMMALTATATPRVSDDIRSSLDLIAPLIQKDSFSRKNIAFKVVFEEDKKYRLKQYCQTLKTSGIVYVRTRRLSEELSGLLLRNGIKATFYHGGITEKEKRKKLEQWLENKVQIMVATNAFGMGIDKPDVALVVHYQIPDCLENYFQEAGRAGRNGDNATAVLITNPTDKEQVKNQFLSILPDVSFVKLVYKKLNTFLQIAYGEGFGSTHPLNFNLFCATYQLNTMLTYNALKILDRNSVVALTESFSKKATVFFKIDKEDLFRYIDEHPRLKDLVKTLLRTYGGIFEHDIKINTVLLAKKLNSDESVITEGLEKLATDAVIDYRGSHSDLELTFLVPRDDDRTVNRFAKNIMEQNTLKEHQIAQTLSYIENNKVCRSIQLLSYFGEENSVACGKCDVCLQSQQLPTNLKLDKERITQFLSTQNANSRTIQQVLKLENELVLIILKELGEDGILVVNNQNQYQLV
jgi:ATP-dependent DNA helicase RecQ